MGRVIDINTGEILAETDDIEFEFHAYIDKVRKTSGESHIRHGRCTRVDSRAFITRLKDEGVETAYDRMVKPDCVLLVQGTAEEWDQEMASEHRHGYNEVGDY